MPALRYQDNVDRDAFFFLLLTRLLFQVLSKRFRQRPLRYIILLYDRNPDDYLILTEPPELLALFHPVPPVAPTRVLYPDTPLLDDELAVVKAAVPSDTHLVTPTLLPCF